jgi:hypothetical protein
MQHSYLQQQHKQMRRYHGNSLDKAFDFGGRDGKMYQQLPDP